MEMYAYLLCFYASYFAKDWQRISPGILNAFTLTDFGMLRIARTYHSSLMFEFELDLFFPQSQMKTEIKTNILRSRPRSTQ